MKGSTACVSMEGRVGIGALLLDTHRPGWAKHIVEAADVLDMGDCGQCVLGVLFGSFSEGLEVLREATGNSQLWGKDTGFDLNTQIDNVLWRDQHEAPAMYDKLGKLWLAEARKRVQEKEPAS